MRLEESLVNPKFVFDRLRREFFLRDAFDRSHGTETCRLCHRWRLRIGRTAVNYEATRPEVFAAACQSLPPECRNYTFIDIGSGKGRALIMAHEFGFRRIVGVELSERLIRICRRNLTRLGIGNISVVAMDATTAPLPESPLVIFLFNPFTSPAIDRFIERIAKHPHPMFLIYVNAKYRHLIEQTGRFTVLMDPGGRGSTTFVVWRSL